MPGATTNKFAIIAPGGVRAGRDTARKKGKKGLNATAKEKR